jgi:hypothetical protein
MSVRNIWRMSIERTARLKLDLHLIVLRYRTRWILSQAL